MVQVQNIDCGIDRTVLSSRNQTVVPARIRRKLGLKKGDKLTWRLVKIGNDYKIMAESEPKSWAEYTLGLGKHTWKNVNIDEYIKNLRDEWDK